MNRQTSSILLSAAVFFLAHRPYETRAADRGLHSRFSDDMQDSAGVMIAGELWDSFFPPNVGQYYSERGKRLTGTFLRIGNFDRFWSTPTHMWPGGWPYAQFWGKGMYLVEFNPDSTWNPPTIAGDPNPAFHGAAGGQYVFASYSPLVLGASDPTRNYLKPVQWLDSTKQHHAIYEAAWPTNIGIDVKVKIHQFTLNWNNFNDCIIVEIMLSNTGVLDLNADGIADSIHTGRQGGNAIRGLALMAHGELFMSCFIGRGGSRSGSRLGASPAIGYVGDSDPKGNPWDLVVAFPGEEVRNAAGLGLNDGVNKYYTDVWSAWAWIGAKSGMASSETAVLLPEKTTIYGTPGIGIGSERGWYATAGQGRRLGVGAGGSLSNPARIHAAAIGVWYADGGRSRDTLAVDLNPDPNFFDSGIPGDLTTFVPKMVPARPRGDRKLLSAEVYNPAAFEVNPYEPGWRKGFTAENNFDGDLFSGLGPFSLEVGASMTIVWAEASGYRMQGVLNAIAAARWLFENGYSPPEPPPVPMVGIEGTAQKTVRVRWDNRAESNSEFAGYKIWRAFRKRPVDWLNGGMRSLDDYWRAQVPGSLPDSLLKPINPGLNMSFVSLNPTAEPGAWGPYELVAVIPQSMVSSHSDTQNPLFAYSWEDNVALLGMEYWYYVSAYSSGMYDLGPGYSGTGAPATTLLETSNVNRNGASGFWGRTYPFADLNPFFPKTSAGRAAIGAPFEVVTPPANPSSLASGQVTIGVKPNPYKRKSFWDSSIDPFDHRIVFYNLPARCTITVLDVSGQIVLQVPYTSSGTQSGTYSWNTFSKNGIEIASGLYVYVVEHEGGKHVGYFSILR